MSNDLLRAIRVEHPFKGVDAYLLIDGTIVFSAAGAVRGLSGASGRTTEIEAYARGMLEEGESLPLVEFIPPNGGRAKGIRLATFVDLVAWWADRYIAGSLGPQYARIGANCAKLQCAASRLGWEGLARSWFGEALPPREVRILFYKYLREAPVEYQRFYGWDLPEALRPLISNTGIALTHERWPVWMGPIHAWLYHTMLGKVVAAKARERRDSTGAKTTHQILCDEALQAISSYMPTFVGLARAATSLQQWKIMVGGVLGDQVQTQRELPFGRR